MTATRAERQEREQIRAWMAEHGLELTASGKIPPAARRQWQALADPEPDPDDDWTDADAADAGGDVTEPGAPPDDQVLAGDPLGALPWTGGPPLSLDDARAQVGAQPRRPAWAGGRRQDPETPAEPAAGRSLFGAPGPDAPARVTRTVRADVEGKLALLLSLPAMTWSLADPFCGAAFADAAPDIAKKMAPLICQSPQAVAWFTKGTTFMMCVELLMALQPVGTAVWRHHMAPGHGQVIQGPDGQLRAAQDQPANLGAYTTQVNGHVPAYRPAA
jgi:hypothetical protein